nr:MAG TPA: NikA, BACTERIAL CONJUGATION, RELAXASE, DNA [Caudoviricetes sp.]
MSLKRNDGSKTYRMEIRLNQEDLGTIEFIQRRTGKSKSQIYRDLAAQERDRLIFGDKKIGEFLYGQQFERR